MTSFFHAYDLRGTYPGEIGEEEACRVGKAFGTWTDADEVLVGRDGRKHGEEVKEAFVNGVLCTGTDVVDAGMMPSPVVYFGMIERGIGAATVVTASHNPSEYTGFKFSKGEALAVSREGGMEEIQEIYESGDFDTGNGRVEETDLKQDYINFVKDKIELESSLDLAVNFGNGVTATIGREMLEALGCSVKGINEEIDGEFPSHLPDPGDEEARRQLEEAMEDEDLGIIFDGDGDRAGFILPDYGYIDADEVLTIFSEESLSKKKGKIVHDLRASKLVKEKIRENGGDPVECKVGHTFVSEMIHSDPEIVFAGELSGHLYFPAYDAPYDDALFAAALMCHIVSERDLRQELESFPEYPVSPEVNMDCPHEDKKDVMDRIAEEYSDYETSMKDGVKITFSDGWALVRPSNTEPKVRLRCEADTEEVLERLLEDVESNVRKFIEEAG